MHRQSNQIGSAHVIIISALVVALLGALGYIYYQNFIVSKTSTQQATTSQAASSTTNSAATPASNIATNTDMNTQKNTVAITEWGVGFDLPSTVKSVSYRVDATKALFPGTIARITAITMTSGVTYALATQTNGQGSDSADAICGYPSVGIMTKNAYTDATSGATTQSVANVDSNYFYNVPQSGGAICGSSTAAAAAIKSVTDAFSSMHKL